MEFRENCEEVFTNRTTNGILKVIYGREKDINANHI